MDDLQVTPQGGDPNNNPLEPNSSANPAPEVSSAPASFSLGDQTATPAESAPAQPAMSAEQVQMPAETAPATSVPEVPAQTEVPAVTAENSAEAPVAEQVPAMAEMGAAVATEVPKKGNLLKIALIAGAVVVVAGAAGAAIFLGKGGPFKGQLAVTETTNTPIRLSATQQELCPTDEYKPLLMKATFDGLDSSLPHANAQSLLQNFRLSPSSLDTSSFQLQPPTPPPPPPIMVQGMTMQPAPTPPPILVQSMTMEPVTCTAISLTPPSLSNVTATALTANVTYSDGNSYNTTVTWSKTGSGSFSGAAVQTHASSTSFTNNFTASGTASVTAKVTGVSGANNSAACQNGVTVSTPAPVLVQSMTMQSTQQPPVTMQTLETQTAEILPPPPVETTETQVTDSCQPIPHDNLVPGGDECNVIDALYESPSTYLLNSESVGHVTEWYNVCHPTTETQQQCETNETYHEESGCECTPPDNFDIKSKFSYYSNGSAPDLAASMSSLGIEFDASQTAEPYCYNCGKTNDLLGEYKTKLAESTNSEEKASLQSVIDTLNKILEAEGCNQEVAPPPPPEEIPECGENQTYSDGQCVCQGGYVESLSPNMCEYDCDAAKTRIDSLKSSPTTESTPEALSELNRLVSNYNEFRCETPLEVPEELTTCEEFEVSASGALETGTWDTYINSINLYIDNDCSGKTGGQCEAILAKASALRTVMNYAESSETYGAQLSELRDQYYANPQCYESDRCSKLETTYGSGGGEVGFETITAQPDVSASVMPAFQQLTASLVFGDDEQYYNEYCEPESCDKIRELYSGVDLNELDITPETRATYAACLSVPEEATESPIMLPPPPPSPPSSGGSGRAPGYVPPAPPSAPTIVSPVISEPAPPPAVTPPTVVSDSEIIEPNAPTFPVKGITQPPAPAPAPEPAPELRPSAPEEPAVVTSVPPEITPTGPEVFVYLFGFIGIQLFLFRRKLLAWVMEMTK